MHAVAFSPSGFAGDDTIHLRTGQQFLKLTSGERRSARHCRTSVKHQIKQHLPNLPVAHESPARGATSLAYDMILRKQGFSRRLWPQGGNGGIIGRDRGSEGTGRGDAGPFPAACTGATFCRPCRGWKRGPCSPRLPPGATFCRPCRGWMCTVFPGCERLARARARLVTNLVAAPPPGGDADHAAENERRKQLGAAYTFHSPRYSRVSHLSSPPLMKVCSVGFHFTWAPW